jgi:hypothetical protein
MVRTTKPKPHRRSKPCRECRQYWTPGGMPCYNCLADIFSGQPIGTNKKIKRERLNARRKLERDRAALSRLMNEGLFI